MGSRNNLHAGLILVCFLLLGMIYALATPIFEASDELNHYPFVQHLTTGQGLPRQTPGQVTDWGQEGSQPPLYYALAAVLTLWADGADLPALLDLNPHAKRGVPLAEDNKNMIIRTAQENFPWRGTVLAVMLVRAFSLLLGAGTVLCTYLLVRRLLPDEPLLALTAMALNAFVPMFLFISASVNNDNLVVFLCSVALLLMVRWVQGGGGARQELLVLGLIIGLAALSKLSGLALLPLSGLALALPAARQLLSADGRTGRQWPGWIFYRDALVRWAADFATVLLPALLVAGWWYVRNWHIYGDPTGLSAMLDIAGRRPADFALLDLLGEFEGFRINFWGLFGAVNILMRPLWLYKLLDIFSLLALLGVGLWGWRIWRREVWADALVFLLPAAWIVLEFVALIRWSSLTAASQGRLIFPTISAIALFLALGWRNCLPERWLPRAIPTPAFALLVLALVAPFTAILPAYPAGADQVVGSLPPTAQPYFVEYGGQARLVGFEVDKTIVHPGDTLQVTLYWQALAPMQDRYSVFVQLFGQEIGLGQSDSYPGGGAHPTTHWQPGQIVRDVHHLFVSGVAPGLRPAWIAAGLYDFETGARPQAVDAHGGQVSLPILTKLNYSWRLGDWQPANPLAANFGNQIRLLGYEAVGEPSAGAAWEYVLYWQAIAATDQPHTLFVHLLDADGNVVSQGDGPPLQGFYPTDRWQAGEILNDRHGLLLDPSLPPASYRVRIGFYNPQSGTRLPLLDESGQIVGDNLILTSLEIGR